MRLARIKQYWLSLVAVFCLVSSSAAQSTETSSSQVQIGIAGQYRVGQWTGIRLDFAEDGNMPLHVETIDGDGVDVSYVDASSDRKAKSKWRYVIPGLASAPLTIRGGDDQEEASGDASVLRRLRFPDESIAADRPWLLVVGDPMGLDLIGKNELLNRAPLATTTVIQDPQTLPDHWLGFEAVDVLIINATAVDLLTRLDDAQSSALLQWVRRGGKVLMTLGKAGPAAIEQSTLLRELIGFSGDPRPIEFDPIAVEGLTASRSPLDPFPSVRLPTAQGQPLLIGRTVDRQQAAVAMRYRYGFGEVVAIAADLDAEPFASWPHRTDLINALAPGMVPREEERRTAPRSGEIAYTDIAGQVRATLDRFPHSRTVPFSLAALILMGLFLLIGPFDYFLINRWLGRPLLGWVTFPLMILLLSGALITWASNADESATVNRLEVIDVDPRTGWGQAFTWAHIFSPAAGRWNAKARLSSFLTEHDDRSLLLSPYGYAGPTFGGVQITDRRLPEYDVLVSRQSEAVSSELREMPLAPVSSKGLAGWVQFETSLQPTEGLVSFRGAELRGSLKNPLPLDLLDGFLLYDNWVYLLPTRFRAGSTIDSVESLRQKTFRWHLTRRKALESSSEMEMWNPRDDQGLARLGEILTFYNVAGGADYTTLTDHPLKRLDFSPSLDTSQAILVGRLEQPAVTLDIRRAGANAVSTDEPVEVSGQTVSILRVMLPVAEENPTLNRSRRD